jgi:GT2 family glycosyltransferase
MAWFDKIGLLKKEYFREGEEQEFSYRTLLYGGRILYFPKVEILHHLNQNERIRSDHMMFKLAHRTENELVYLPFGDLLATVPWRLFYRFWQALRERWLRGYWRSLFLLLQASPRIWKERKKHVFDRNKINLLRTLKCYIVEDFGQAMQNKTSIYDWIKVKANGKPLGVIASSRSDNG